MISGNNSAHGSATPGGPSLPPVEPPSALFILQLFLVPGILVAAIIAVIWVFFGWIGGGPQTPNEFLDGLRDPSAVKRWKTAQDLAQLLPRRPDLRGDVKFALDLTELAHQEMNRPPTADEEKTEHNEGDLFEYLPGALGSFHVPVGYPLLSQIIQQDEAKIGEPTYRLRLRNAVVAVGILGATMREYDTLPVEARDRIRAELKDEALGKPPRRVWAEQAHEYLEHREQRLDSDSIGPGLAPAGYRVADTLRIAATSADEMTRKYAILALANWDEPGVERVLLELTGDNSDIRYYENEDHERGRREIRHNAALALARRGSPLTPWSLVLETLDAKAMIKSYPAEADKAVALGWVLKALRDLQEFKRTRPEEFARQTEIIAAVEQLAASDPPIAVKIEAEKLLSSRGGSTTPAVVTRFPREVLIGVTLGAAVLFLLALAAIARWRRTPAAR